MSCFPVSSKRNPAPSPGSAAALARCGSSGTSFAVAFRAGVPQFDRLLRWAAHEIAARLQVDARTCVANLVNENPESQAALEVLPLCQ